MPVVLRYKGYTFFFYSNEGIPRERKNAFAKAWKEHFPVRHQWCGTGIHWDKLDEDISVEHLLLGHWDRTRASVSS
ncbi:DUF2442 domain-containing protein [Massilia sp. GCM10020059]|uniref:DUF2442 domain-containing protein n=1 Tax=Massilia TaxID=149698 RepID=UPI003530613F